MRKLNSPATDHRTPKPTTAPKQKLEVVNGELKSKPKAKKRKIKRRKK